MCAANFAVDRELQFPRPVFINVAEFFSQLRQQLALGAGRGRRRIAIIRTIEVVRKSLWKGRKVKQEIYPFETSAATYQVCKLLGCQLLARMIGPTGNLRAPTARVGRTLLVGFSEEAYRRVLGA